MRLFATPALMVLATAGILFAPLHANADTIDFNTLPGPNQSPFYSYTEGQYNVSTIYGNVYAGTNFGFPAPSLFADTGGVNVTRVFGGGAFEFFSVELANATLTAENYFITGYYNIFPVFTLSGTVAGFREFNPYGFGYNSQQLTELHITLTSSSTDLHEGNIDDIRVAAAPPPAPEPSSFVLLATGLAGAAATVRRRKPRSFSLPRTPSIGPNAPA